MSVFSNIVAKPGRMDDSSASFRMLHFGMWKNYMRSCREYRNFFQLKIYLKWSRTLLNNQWHHKSNCCWSVTQFFHSQRCQKSAWLSEITTLQLSLRSQLQVKLMGRKKKQQSWHAKPSKTRSCRAATFSTTRPCNILCLYITQYYSLLVQIYM